MNMYVYVRGDPVNYSDPTGNSRLICIPYISYWYNNPFFPDSSYTETSQNCFWIDDEPSSQPPPNQPTSGGGGGTSDGGDDTTKPPPCNTAQRLLQGGGKLIGSLGADVAAAGAATATIGLGLGMVSPVVTAINVPTGISTAVYGGQLMARGAATITVGGAIVYLGAMIQTAGGAPKDAVFKVANDIASRLVPTSLGRYYAKEALKAAEESLPDIKECT